MSDNIMAIDFHKFVDEKLMAEGLQIVLLNKEIVEQRIDDYLKFINSVRNEYKIVYGWKDESKEYILNGLIDKWKYSYSIINKKNELLLINFSSLYGGNTVHMHFTYAARNSRNMDLGKLHMLKLCQTAIDNNVHLMEGFFPKYNSGSIILHLKMGWKIETMRNNFELLIQAVPEECLSKTYKLLK